MKKKILLIEDDQIFANVYRNKFLLEGFEVDVAHDGEVGLEKVRSFLPDVVVLDLMLPKLPGVDVIKRIRLDSDLQQLPLVVFTNTYLTSMVQEAAKAGATQCLAKADSTPKQVIRTLRAILDRDSRSQEPASPAPAEPPSTAVLVPPPVSPEDPTAYDSDDEFQAGLRSSFVESLPLILSALRTLLQGLVKAENESARVQHVQQLHRRVRGLTSNAGMVGVQHVAQMSDALEALLKELQEKPKTINASTMRTVASAIDFLGILFERNGRPTDSRLPEASVLVVDDEAIARRAIAYALEKARLKSVAVGDPLQALQLLPEKTFDLVFLDVDMPTMNGYELCTQLRTLPSYKKTPVVFVTSLNDFESRVNSSMSGGNDFIAKPFLFIELAVKALVYVMGVRLDGAGS
jgi:DNA-binding response OmpR family regulator